jgi:hypothetical protein
MCVRDEDAWHVDGTDEEVRDRVRPIGRRGVGSSNGTTREANVRECRSDECLGSWSRNGGTSDL